MNKSPADGTWLEPVLLESLRPVAAPAELWDRVQLPRTTDPVLPRRPLTWALACGLGLVLLMPFVNAHHDLNASRESLAIGLLGSTDSVSLRCGQGIEIRSWIKANTGLDVPLADAPEDPVRLVGVSALAGRVPTARVAYRLLDHDAVLLVSAASGSPANLPGHGLTREVLHNGTRAVSWTMRGQTYTLACADPADLQIACRLCHSGAESSAVLD